MKEAAKGAKKGSRMGAVHGVILKYVGLTAVASAAHVWVESALWKWIALYVAVANFLVTLGFLMNVGTSLIGKKGSTGQLPLWSYVVWLGFIGPTWLYTAVHTLFGKTVKGVDEADEVLPGWWLGSRYADLAQNRPARFSGVLDLTCELPERLFEDADEYKLVQCWDGTPPSPQLIEEAAQFCVGAAARGHVLVHCAHGRGRSTTVMVAALVKAGKFDNWRDAFAACKLKRPAVKLNAKMRSALTKWEASQ
mmetsp:Transcript_18867/g.58079  ORF Transcript_18867/g.58079 Transcript_18867/m.58079 type:complete len:251 (+) Transcript_18867:2-754(+)